MSLSRTRRVRGNSFIEVLVAIFIVAGAAMVFGALVPPAVKTEKMVGNYQQAVSLVQHKVDQLRAVGYGRLNYVELQEAGIIDVTPTSLPYRFNVVDGLDNFFPSPVGTVQIEDFNVNVRKVTVTLTWTGSHTRQGNGSISVQALIGRS